MLEVDLAGQRPCIPWPVREIVECYPIPRLIAKVFGAAKMSSVRTGLDTALEPYNN